MTNKITPTCKYHATPLTLVAAPSPGAQWAYSDNNGAGGYVFTGDLYVCEFCGYTELFDNDLATTLSQNEVDE